MIRKVAFTIIVASVLYSCSEKPIEVTTPPTPTQKQIRQSAKEEIFSALQKWAEDFNNKNIPAVCELFAPNLVASYPGTQDKDYEAMCQHLTKALSTPNKQYIYEVPVVEEMIIDRDLAVVRLLWTLRISDKSQPNVTLVKEKGLDVFTRQPDGKWKISVSYAYPE